jgi:hypothetical protein
MNLGRLGPGCLFSLIRPLGPSLPRISTESQLIKLEGLLKGLLEGLRGCILEGLL